MNDKISFEQGMLELEKLARALENGEMSLDDSFKAYERAMELKKQLEKLLEEGDRRIRLLSENGETAMDSEDFE